VTKKSAAAGAALRPLKSEAVADALVSAAAALAPVSKEPVWSETPKAFTEIRRFFAPLRDNERRRVLFTLLVDEGGRLRYERSL
jgi:hypothetical protein